MAFIDEEKETEDNEEADLHEVDKEKPYDNLKK